MTCHVTGLLEAISGEPFAGASVRIRCHAVWSNGEAVIVPVEQVVTVTDGAVSVELHPGEYEVIIATGASVRSIPIQVPDEAEADLADLIDNLPPLDPPLVAQARQYRDQARTARDEAHEAIPAGQPGQVIGYGSDGEPIAMGMPPAELPDGGQGQLVGYDENGLAVAVDPPLPQLSSQQW